MNIDIDLKFTELEEITVCAKCGQPKAMKITILGKERIVPTMCDCRKEELEKQERKENQERIERKVSELIAQGIMDRQYLNNTFANDNGTNKKVSELCQRYVKNWGEIKKENIGMLLYGDVGRGKTFYACCIANELLKQGVSICITSFPKLIDKLSNFDETSKLLVEKAKTQSLLIIDDLGVERQTEFVAEQMFKIIDERVMSGLPTIITTNLSVEDLENPKNIEYRRIYSRILQMCPIKILVENQNNRQADADRKEKIARDILK